MGSLLLRRYASHSLLELASWGCRSAISALSLREGKREGKKHKITISLISV